MGEGNVFTRVCPSIHPSVCVHTPTRTGYTAVGMSLAFTQEDFLVFEIFLEDGGIKDQYQWLFSNLKTSVINLETTLEFINVI